MFGLLGSMASGLGKEATRNLARNLFSGFYERGLSANQALSQLRELGLGYRRQDFLRDFSEGKGSFEQATRVRFVNELKTPSEGILEDKYHGVPDKYSLVFKAIGTGVDDGEDREQYFFYHRNTLSTRKAMEEDAFDWLSSESDRYGIEISGVSLVEGYINPLWS